MSKKDSAPGIPEYIRRIVLLATVIITVSVAGLVIAQQLALYNHISERMREEGIEKQKQFIKDLIAIEMDYVSTQKKAFDDEIAYRLADNVRTASQLALDLYVEYHDQLSHEKLKNLIVNGVGALRSFSPYAHVFINTMDGVGVYYQGSPEFTGRDLNELTDRHGNRVIQTEIDLIKKAGGGFINYGRSNAGTDELSDKICYVEEFQPLGWYLGAKCYIDDYSDDFKMEIARKISSERFRYGGYVFMSDKDGSPIVQNGRICAPNEGVANNSGIEQHNVIMQQLDTARSNPEGGYMDYMWDEEDGKGSSRKISYVRYFEPCNWVIGAGFYVDEVKNDLLAQNAELRNGLISNIVQIVFLLLLAVLAELYFLYRFNFNFKTDFNEFNRFFRLGKGSYEKMNVEKIHFREFYEMGVVANQMIGERSRIHDQLVDQQKKAQESDRLKTAFLANMSHEIRTPMNAILGFSELLDDDELDENIRKDFVRLIRQNGQMLMALINDIIDVAKIESGQMSVIKDWFKLSDMLGDLQTHFSGVIANDPEKSIRFEMKTNIPDDYRCFSDAFRLKQVLYNLIGNAIKFTHSGSVVVETKLESSRIYFTITDTGIGISQEDLNTIFERFMQAGNHKEKNFGGTGLGLAICKNIVTLLDGEIHVESVETMGSKFQFYIPVA